jgi:hypothetical protein
MGEGSDGDYSVVPPEQSPTTGLYQGKEAQRDIVTLEQPCERWIYFRSIQICPLCSGSTISKSYDYVGDRYNIQCRNTPKNTGKKDTDVLTRFAEVIQLASAATAQPKRTLTSTKKRKENPLIKIIDTVPRSDDHIRLCGWAISF